MNPSPSIPFVLLKNPSQPLMLLRNLQDCQGGNFHGVTVIGVGGGSQNQRDLPRDIPLDSVVVLRYEKMSKSENKGKVPTEMELVLEQTQQGEHILEFISQSKDGSTVSMEDEEVSLVDGVLEGALGALALEMEALVDAMEIYGG
ncbi:hypothetical protein Tco_1066152 [Tanacetum coccineum]